MPYQAIVLMQAGDEYRIVSWNGDMTVSKEQAPDYTLTQKLFLQRISLPIGVTEESFEALKEKTAQCLPYWSDIAMLKDVPVLLLNESLTTKIGKDSYFYTKECGLQKIHT